MVKFGNGTKVSDAYVNDDGTITEAVYTGNTPLCAENLNLAQQIDVGQVTITEGTTITNGYELTLPVTYEVGNNSLALYLEGERLIKATDTTDGHYTEIGDDDEESTTIALYRTDDDGDWTLTEDITIIAVVKGVGQD